jgi:tetratricopeptide (TPR) repeat protein
MSSQSNPIDAFGQENRAAYSRLVEALSQGNVFGFVGAGLSQPLGYPLWREFLEQLRASILERSPSYNQQMQTLDNVDDLPVRAKRLKAILQPGDFDELVRKTFGPRTPPFSETHERLLDLPLRHILTTNYDCSIEAALANRSTTMRSCVLEDYDVSSKVTEHFDGPELLCIHVHGVVDHPSGLVLTLDDYNRLYEHDRRPSSILKSLLATRQALFVGFSLLDEDALSPFRFINSLYNRETPRHFALVGVDGNDGNARRITYNDRYGINPIYYSSSDAHRDLDVVLCHLRNDVTEMRGRASQGVISATILSDITHLSSALPPHLRVPFEAVIRQYSGDSVLAMGDGSASTPLDHEIDTIFELVEQGLPDVAIERYRSMLERVTSLRGRVRYRILANIGNAYYEKGEWGFAADNYLDAVTQYHTSKEARALEVLAYILRNDVSRAFELANKLCLDHPEYPRAHAFRVRTMSSQCTFQDVEQSVPEVARSDSEVGLALAHCASERLNTTDAERYLRAVLTNDSKWLPALSTLANLLIQKAKQASYFDPECGLIPEDTALPSEAAQLYSQIINRLTTADPGKQLGPTYWNRSLARRMLRCAENASQDIEKAYHLAPTVTDIRLGMAMQHHTHGRIDEAIKLVQTTNEPVEPHRRDILLASYLQERNAPGDVACAIDIVKGYLTNLAVIGHSEDRVDVLRLAVRLCQSEADRKTLSVQLDTLASDLISSVSRFELQAGLAFACGDRANGLHLIDSALAAFRNDPSTSALARLNLALLAEQQELWPAAAAVWRSLASPKHYNSAARRFLRASESAHDDVSAMEFCGQLRSSNIHIRECYFLEAQILERCREPAAAIDLLNKWLTNHPDDRYSRLCRSAIAIQWRIPGHGEEDPEKLPAVHEVKSGLEGARVAFVLRNSTNPMNGLNFAYQLWRRFPDDKDARRALILAAVSPHAPPLPKAEPAMVEVGCAVQLEQTNGSRLWLVIEKGPSPQMSRDEYAPDHPWSVALLGRAVGDQVAYTRTRYTIVAICPAVALRLQECLSLDEKLFPDDPIVRAYSVPTERPRSSDPADLLGDAWTEIEAAVSRKRELEAVRQREGVPLAIIANASRRTVLETALEHIERPDLVLHCTHGVPDELRAAQSCLQGDPEIVLDSTALATIVSIGMVNHLSRLPVRLIVPRSVLQELRLLMLDWEYVQEPRLSIGVHRGRARLHRVSVSQAQTYWKRLQWVHRQLQDHCQVTGGQPVLALEPPLRRAMEDAFGHSTTDAIAIAKARSATLWIDDLALAGMLSRFGVAGRVWTQLVINQATASGHLPLKCALAWTETLLIRNVSFTSLSVAAIVKLLKKNKWSGSSAFTKALLRQAAQIGMFPATNCSVFGSAILHIWHHASNNCKPKQVVWRLLTAIGSCGPADVLAQAIVRVAKKSSGWRRAEVKQFEKEVELWIQRYRKTQTAGAAGKMCSPPSP